MTALARHKDATRTLQTLRQLLSHTRLQGQDMDLMKTVTGMRPMHPDQLQACFTENRAQVPSKSLNEFAYPLPRVPANEPFVALLSLRWTFGGSNADAGLVRVYLIHKTRNLRRERQSNQNLSRMLILRYEPEEPNATWAFSHAQTCDKNDDIYQSWRGLKDNRISGSLPRIPLIGVSNDAQSLVLALVVSLYGLDSQEYRRVAVGDNMTDSAKAVDKQLRRA